MISWARAKRWEEAHWVRMRDDLDCSEEHA